MQFQTDRLEKSSQNLMTNEYLKTGILFLNEYLLIVLKIQTEMPYYFPNKIYPVKYRSRGDYELCININLLKRSELAEFDCKDNFLSIATDNYRFNIDIINKLNSLVFDNFSIIQWCQCEISQDIYQHLIKNFSYGNGIWIAEIKDIEFKSNNSKSHTFQLSNSIANSYYFSGSVFKLIDMGFTKGLFRNVELIRPEENNPFAFVVSSLGDILSKYKKYNN